MQNNLLFIIELYFSLSFCKSIKTLKVYSFYYFIPFFKVVKINLYLKLFFSEFDLFF
jgi:hypothetical protein